jgi:hypothetical protein
MPPKRSESWQKAANQEGKILFAIQDLQKGNIKSLRAAAELYNIPFPTLRRRAIGVSSRVDKYHHRQKLTQIKEDSLTK